MDIFANRKTGSGGLLLIIVLGLAIIPGLLALIWGLVSGLISGQLTGLTESEFSFESIPIIFNLAFVFFGLLYLIRIIAYIGIFYYIKEAVVIMWATSILLFLCSVIILLSLMPDDIPLDFFSVLSTVIPLVGILIYPLIITILIRPIRPFFHKFKSPYKDKWGRFFARNKNLILWIALVLLLIPVGVVLINKIEFQKEELQSEKNPNNSTELTADFLGEYQGIQKSYFMKNDNGEEIIIGGNKIPVPGADFKFLLKERNIARLYLTNTEDNKKHYYGGLYKIISNESDMLELEISLNDGQGSSPTYILKINKLDKKGNCIGENEPVFKISKIEIPQTSQESNNITENIPLKNESNYKIRVKEGVKNVNVRDNYIVDQSKVLTRISYPETYTVTKEKIIGNSENAIYLLNRKTQLTDVNNGQSYTFEKGKKVKLLTTQGQHYNAEIELDNKTIITNIPVVNVERQDIQKWLYLKELNGWILSKFVEETNENKAEKIAIGTVTIGSQTWASKDLSVTNYSNGDPIFEAKTDRQWEQFGKDRVGCYRILGNGTFVYNGYALKNKKGLIPYGFSVPKKSDFETLYMYLGGEKIASEKAVKSLITYNWSEEREDLVNGGIVDVVLKGNNSSGFNARLGGFVYDHGLAQDGNFNFWWTVSSGGDNQLILSSIGGTNTDMGGSRFDSVPFSFGCAIRLIKN